MAVRKVCFSDFFFSLKNVVLLVADSYPFTYQPRILKNWGDFEVLFTICSYDFVCVHKSVYCFLCAITKALVKTLFIPYRIFAYKTAFQLPRI